MRLKITLQRTNHHQQLLPVNYSYPLSCWIYRIIQQADAGYSDFLHNHGHQIGNKRFKFFTFSALDIPKFKLESGSDRIRLFSEEIAVTVSFYANKAAEHFVMGLFADQTLLLGDRISQVGFRVKQVESLDWQISSQTIRMRTLSPLVVSRKNNRGMDNYLSPTEEGYTELLTKNLLDKYLASENPLHPNWMEMPIVFQLHTPLPKSRLITLKDHTPAATRVKGYLFDFDLTAPCELLEIGLLAGFGRYNAEGFGCCEVVEPKTKSP